MREPHAILNASLPVAPWMDARLARLPGLLPLDPADWLLQSDTFAAQMALRDEIVDAETTTVIRAAPKAAPALAELLAMVLEHLTKSYRYGVSKDCVARPDGVRVTIDREQPLRTLGRLVQEDLCLLEACPGGSVLTAAVLCFPASWRLDEKFLQPLPFIHRRIAPYDTAMAKRVQRVFNGVHPDRPLWRANALGYDDPALFQPRRRAVRPASLAAAPYIRSERQCLLRLPKTRAVVFSIHTFVVRQSDLTPEQKAGLPQA